jgi:RHS repeat-associated protein
MPRVSWYIPFGQVRTDAGSITQTDFGYTGQRALDAQNNQYTIGFMDYKARFYSAYISHFSQPDTIIPDQNNPQTWNRYAYVKNNPVRFYDPTGHMCSDPEDPNPTCDGSYQTTTHVGNRVLRGNVSKSTNLATAMGSDNLTEASNTVTSIIKGTSDSFPIMVPTPQTELSLSPNERLLDIEIGLFFVVVGSGITDLGIIIVGTAGIELAGGVATGPFAPLVAADSLKGMVIGGLTIVSGLFIMGAGSFFLYMGITGKKPRLHL